MDRFSVGCRFALLMSLLAVAPWAAAQGDPPPRLAAVLDKAPADAQMLVLVPDLARLSDLLSQTREDLGMPYPDLDDALGAFKRRTGMLDGVEDSGAALLVLDGLDQMAAPEVSPRVRVLVPVSDAGAFVSQFGGDPEAASTAVQMRGGESGFARPIDDHVLLAGDQATVDGFEPAGASAALLERFAPLGARYLTEADAAVIIDLSQTDASVHPQLVEAGLKAVSNTLAALIAAPPAPAAPTGRSRGGPADPMFGDPFGPPPTSREQVPAQDGEADILPALFAGLIEHPVLRQGLTAMMEQSDAMLLAVQLDDDDTAVTLAFRVKEDSDAAGAFTAGSDQTDALLAALPDQPYLLAMAGDLDAADLVKLLVGDGDGDASTAHPLLRLKAEAMPLAEQVRTAATALYSPQGNAVYSGNLLDAVAIYRVDDGPKFIEGLTAYFRGLNAIEPGPDGTSYQGDYIENALRLADDVRVDQYKLNPIIARQTLQGMSPTTQFLISSMFPINGYIAAKGNDVVLTTSLDTQQITRALAALEQKAGLGTAAAIAGRRDQTMPPDPSAEVYLGVDGLAGFANVWLPTQGLPGVALPGDAPPLSLGVTAEDRAVVFRLTLPDASARYLLQTSSLLTEQMRAGGR